FSPQNSTGGGVTSTTATLQKAVVVGKKEDATAQFTGLKPEAQTAGLGDVVLIGTPTFTSLAGEKSRVKIDWHSIQRWSGDKNITEGLRSGLLSQFVVSGDRAEVG